MCYVVCGESAGFFWMVLVARWRIFFFGGSIAFLLLYFGLPSAAFSFGPHVLCCLRRMRENWMCIFSSGETVCVLFCFPLFFCAITTGWGPQRLSWAWMCCEVGGEWVWISHVVLQIWVYFWTFLFWFHRMSCPLPSITTFAMDLHVLWCLWKELDCLFKNSKTLTYSAEYQAELLAECWLRSRVSESK